MADKVQLIKEEIERLKHNTPNAYDLSRFMLLEEIESFINSLPEEPKKQPKFRVGDTIKGPCNNVFQVKEVLDTQYLLHSENGDELNSIEIVDKYSCLEEPVSEGLEEELHSWMRENCDDNGFFNQLELARHFAEWGRNHFEDKIEMVSEDLEEYAKKLTKGAALNKHNLIWMCKKGAEWQKQKDQEIIGNPEESSCEVNCTTKSEDLEESARYYLLNNHVSPLNDIMHQVDLNAEMQYHKDIENAFKAGAEWQKKHIMRDTINGIMDCDDDNEWIEITDKLIVTPSKAGKKVKFIVVKEE